MTNIAHDLAVVGLGPMGAPIARRLLREHQGLTVWNRTAGVAEPLGHEGAQVASRLSEAAHPIVITVLPDLPQVEEVVTGLTPGWQERGISNPVLVIHGTVSATAVRAYSERMAARGVTVIDAPVSGGTQGADAGTLSIMVGGDRSVAQSLEPIFACYGRTIRYMGESGAGALTKLCNQIVVASTVTGLAEATALARQAGLDLADVFEILEGGLANSEVLRQKVPRFMTDDFAGGGSARNQLKDLRYVAEAAASQQLELPMVRAATGLFQKMVDLGYGTEDHSAVIKVLERPSRQQ